MSMRAAEFGDERQGAANYLDALREHWLLIGAIVTVAVATAAAYSYTATKQYEAGADLLVTPISSTDQTYVGIPGLLRETDQGRAVLTAARLVRSAAIAERVDRKLGVSWTREQTIGAVVVTPLGQSNIVTIVGKASSPQRAADIANAFADELVADRTELFQAQLRDVVSGLRGELRTIPQSQQNLGLGAGLSARLAALLPLVGKNDPTLQVSGHATAPVTPVWPRPVLSIAIALIAASLLGVGIAVGLELISPRVNREEELLLRQRLPILARVPRMRRGAVKNYLRGDTPLPGAVREAYRTLRASLANAGPDDGFPHTILVTSAIPGEAKTMTSVNIATTLANAGLRVILIDGDLRRPMVATVFGIASSRSGFAQVLEGRARPEDVLVPAPGSRDQLRLLLASPEHAHLVDLLQPRRIEGVLAELRLLADVVVIDSAPLTEVADALNLADQVDAVVVAVRLGRSRRDKLNELRRMLARRGVSPVGFVVTTKSRPRRGEGYYYGRDAEKSTRSRQPLPAEQQPEPVAAPAPRAEADDL